MNRLLKLTACVLVAVCAMGSWASADEDHDHESFYHLVFKQGSLHVHAQFESKPESKKEAVLLLETKDPTTHQNIAISDQIKVILWMPGMGHGSSPTKIENAIDQQGHLIPGVFRVSRMFFMMDGEWEVRVQLTDADGNKETESFKIFIGEDN